MAAIVNIGQTVRGKVGIYTILKQLNECIWLAKFVNSPNLSICVLVADRHSNQNQENVVVKSIRHFRLQNERDVLLRFQSRSQFIRPLLDEVQTTQGLQSLVLRYLDNDILCASNTKRLTRLEVKYVAQRVLSALAVLHEDGFVHTGMSFQKLVVHTDML
jgi:hypothetical protein